MIRKILALLKFRYKYRREFKYRKHDTMKCSFCGTTYHNWKGKLTTCIRCKNIMN